MRYFIIAVAALIAMCLSISALSQQSEVDKYINNSLRESQSYESDDAFGPATPHEAREANEEVHKANATEAKESTAPNATAQDASLKQGFSSLVDDYINSSINKSLAGSYDSDDPMGTAIPRESRRLNEETHRKK